MRKLVVTLNAMFRTHTAGKQAWHQTRSFSTDNRHLAQRRNVAS
jgi:hypothetical protein